MDILKNINENCTNSTLKKSWTTPSFEIIYKDIIKTGSNTGKAETFTPGTLHDGTYYS
jgi:hypothetical protein